MITKFTDGYGFECLTVLTDAGGRKTFIYFGGTTDIGLVSGMNSHGVGSADYIRNEEDVDRHISYVKQTIWLNKEEKETCIEFLEYIKMNPKRNQK